MHLNYLHSVKKEFTYYKLLAEKTIAQLPEDKLFWKFNDESNSIAIIIKHMNGNMLSRWTDFLTMDGEKAWRDRDQEFSEDAKDKSSLMNEWSKAWDCLFSAIDAIKPEDLEAIIFIRNQGHTVVEAINRQLSHYPYHIGQIIFIGKMICGPDWVSLSIPKNQSATYNENHFSKPKELRHFTDEADNNTL